MNINVQIGHCSDDPRNLSRTVTDITSFTLTNVYGGLSSMSPVIICDIDSETAYTDQFATSFFNYMIIGSLKYWITDATYTPQEHWIFSLKKDLLGSYGSQILNCDAIAIRTSDADFSFLTDSQVPVLNSTEYIYTEANAEVGDRNPCYVLTTVGSGTIALDNAAAEVANQKAAAQQMLSKESTFYDTLTSYFSGS